MTIDPLLTLASFGIGIVVGLTGMGGGALMTPVLVLFFSIPPLTAVSYDLVASAVMKPVGSYVHLRRGTVHLGSGCASDPFPARSAACSSRGRSDAARTCRTWCDWRWASRSSWPPSGSSCGPTSGWWSMPADGTDGAAHDAHPPRPPPARAQRWTVDMSG